MQLLALDMCGNVVNETRKKSRKQMRYLGKGRGGLRDALKETGIEYTLQEGEGAFYGPKIEYYLKR